MMHALKEKNIVIICFIFGQYLTFKSNNLRSKATFYGHLINVKSHD